MKGPTIKFVITRVLISGIRYSERVYSSSIARGEGGVTKPSFGRGRVILVQNLDP